MNDIQSTIETTLREFWNDNDCGTIFAVSTACPAGIEYHQNTETDVDEDFCDLNELIETGLFACNYEESASAWNLTGIATDGRWVWDGKDRITDGSGNDYTQIVLLAKTR